MSVERITEIPPSPGDVLRDWIENHPASRIPLTDEEVAGLISGSLKLRKGITDLPWRLARFTGIKPLRWLEIERIHEETLGQLRHVATP